MIYLNRNDISSLKQTLENLNSLKYKEICEILRNSVENFLDNVKWRFVNEHGLRLPFINKDSPLMWKFVANLFKIILLIYNIILIK